MAGAALFALNAYVALRLFQVEFYDHMASVEGLFIAITRHAMQYPHDLTWLRLWYSGMPFHQVYPPGIHVAAAWLGAFAGWSPAHAWHFTVGFLYCLGPVFLFWTAWRLSGRFFAALAAGLLWTLFSPSCLLVPSIWHDTGEMVSNRRLHNIVVWGEGPNAATLGIVVLTVGLLHLALTRGRRIHYFGAVIATALVPLCSWPAFTALLLAIASYLLSRDPSEWKRMIVRLVAIGAMAYALVAVWIPPSTVRATFLRTKVMMGAPQPGAGQYLAALGTCIMLAGLWLLCRRFRLPFWFRFAAFNLALTGGITLASFYAGVQLLTQAYRFHLAMEIAFVLAMAFGMSLLVENKRPMQYLAACILLVFAVFQTPAARRYARREMAPVKIESTYEYQVASWLDGHMHGQRIAAMGSAEFWMNVFDDNPQLNGCCEQANTSWMNDVAAYTLVSADSTGSRDVEIRSAWMKAWGVHAIVLGGPKTRDAYHGIRRPESLIGGLPVIWHSGDDYVLEVPSRSNALGHVMRHADLPSRRPVNGLDVAPLEQYVNALDNPSYPLTDERWPNQHTVMVRAALTPDEILSFQMMYWPGWSAIANGKPVPVKRDTFGLLYVEPMCAGDCTITMTWDGGVEARILWWLRLAAMLTGLAWLVRRTDQSRSSADGVAR